MKRRLSIVALLMGLCAFPASAVLDSNENGLSDLWEMRYNNGTLPDPGFDPLEDPDGDGWTNAKEAAAGTNPFDANPPDGHLQPLITHSPEVWVEVNGIPELQSPEAITLTWPTIAGKQYTLMMSSDLLEWVPVPDETFIGSGLDVEYGITLPNDDKLFWRVAVEDVDSDSDGLTDAEEAELGTAPDSPETLAGYPDMWLAEHYLPNLLNNEISLLDLDGDPDEDGLTNAQEDMLGKSRNVADNDEDTDQDRINNGDFSLPLIPTGYNWKSWGSGNIAGWAATTGTNIEYQIITPKEAGNQYVELKADPDNHYGIKQTVGTRIGVTYIFALDCRARAEIFTGAPLAAWDSNFDIKIEGTTEGTITKPIDFSAAGTATPPDQWTTVPVVFTANDVTVKISLVPLNNLDNRMGGLVDNVALAPLGVAVDANRDGEITFDGKDKTAAEKPFRFWINNDQDDVEYDEPILVGMPDYYDRETIKTKRDLEDFCRLKVQVGISNQILRDGDLQIGLVFRSVTEGNPGIRILGNQSSVGNSEYLTQDSAATAQIALIPFEKYPPDQLTLIPLAYWAGREDSIANLIFEGTSKGKGELVVTIHDKHGAKLAECPGTWLQLLDVREMYRRARIVNEPEQIDEPWVNQNPPAQTWEWDDWNWPYSEDLGAEPVTAVFVHGWRLKYWDFMNWSDTSYKRLWHQGFKGKFYSFRWATFSGDNNGLPYGLDENLEGTKFPPGGTTYNASEYRAWLCGPALADFVNQLPNPDNRKLFAHSMGNVISGAALRSGMEVQSYAMCNAAMSAMAYDSTITHPDCLSYRTPDTDHDSAIQSGYGIANKFNLSSMPNVFSFGLPNDQSLGSWSANNALFKPDNIKNYYYDEYPMPMTTFRLFYNPFENTFREVTGLPEAMAYVTQSRSRAAGADLRTSGCIGTNNTINMAEWFGETHSAQWRWNNQSTHMFWENLVEKLELNPSN